MTEQPPRNEKQLQARIVKKILELRPNAWIFHPVGSPYQLPGIPDLLICIDGLFIAMELKHQRPGESVEHAKYRATEQQRRQIRLINHAGGTAAVVTSVEEALAVVHKAIKCATLALQADLEKEPEDEQGPDRDTT